MKLYSRGDIVVYCADARDVLPGLNFDLLVTDPPYGNAYKSNMREVLDGFDRIAGDNDQDMVLEVLRVAWRCLRINRHGYVFGPITPSQAIPDEVGGVTELIWDKSAMSGGNLALPWGNSHETIWFGVKRYVGKRSADTGKLVARMRRGTVLRVTRAGETSRVHPTQKPVDLMGQLIEMSSNRGDVVCDPFMGSGSTLIAAAIEGRAAIGIEVDEHYCQAAIERLDRVLDLTDELGKIK